MTRYNNFADVKGYSKYRIDILNGKYKGVYMYDFRHDERQFLTQISRNAENNTIIYFMERILDDEKRPIYDIVDRIEIIENDF